MCTVVCRIPTKQRNLDKQETTGNQGCRGTGFGIGHNACPKTRLCLCFCNSAWSMYHAQISVTVVGGRNVTICNKDAMHPQVSQIIVILWCISLDYFDMHSTFTIFGTFMCMIGKSPMKLPKRPKNTHSSDWHIWSRDSTPPRSDLRYRYCNLYSQVWTYE